ncbi:MAG: hypothetical protein NUV56_00915 [Candidatus Uhrbacteria bacterium]|nr:hypothetical protein [Candidatus Uhrbacteria bacterium]
MRSIVYIPTEDGWFRAPKLRQGCGYENELALSLWKKAGEDEALFVARGGEHMPKDDCIVRAYTDRPLSYVVVDGGVRGDIVYPEYLRPAIEGIDYGKPSPLEEKTTSAEKTINGQIEILRRTICFFDGMVAVLDLRLEAVRMREQRPSVRDIVVCALKDTIFDLKRMSFDYAVEANRMEGEATAERIKAS